CEQVILVVNKMDTLTTREDAQAVISFVKQHVKTGNGASRPVISLHVVTFVMLVLQDDPVVFPVSARDALQAKMGLSSLRGGASIQSVSPSSSSASSVAHSPQLSERQLQVGNRKHSSSIILWK